ncbi:hypothetical protein GCM10027416_05080 [Okibacterium endophyticum]
MSLDVTDLSITIDGRAVVDGVSFSVQQGERFGIIGSSGSGKSLTALAILGLLPEGAGLTGSIRYEGRELVGRGERELAAMRGNDISIVFQEPRTALNPIRTVGRQMTEPLRIHGGLSRRQAQARAIELARLVSLRDPETVIGRYPHQLSGGQRQRVGIAMALAARPRILIADEPTTALDVTIQAEILSLFDRLVTELGTTLVFITHDLAVLRQVATDAVVLDQGRVVEAAPVSRLLSEPATSVTRNLVDAARATGWRGARGTRPAEGPTQRGPHR